MLLSTLRFGAFLSNYILLNSAPIYCGLWIFSKAFLSSSSFRTNPGVSAVGISDGVVYFDAGHFMCEFSFIFQTKCCYPEIWVVCGSTPSDCGWSLDSGFVTYLAIFRSFLLLQCNSPSRVPHFMSLSSIGTSARFVQKRFYSRRESSFL